MLYMYVCTYLTERMDENHFAQNKQFHNYQSQSIKRHRDDRRQLNSITDPR